MDKGRTNEATGLRTRQGPWNEGKGDARGEWGILKGRTNLSPVTAGQRYAVKSR